MAKKQTTKKESTTEKKGNVNLTKIKNEADHSHTEVYYATCNFTTLAVDKNGVTYNKKVEKGDEVTAKEVPLQWIRMSVDQRYLISKTDKDKLTNEEKRQRGYTVR